MASVLNILFIYCLMSWVSIVMQAFRSHSERGCSLVVTHELLIIVSFVVEHGFWNTQVCSWHTGAPVVAAVSWSAGSIVVMTWT